MRNTGSRRRLFFFVSVLTLLLVVVVVRLVQLMVLEPARQPGEPIRLPVVERGPILDRNGKILAITTRLNSVAAWVPDLRSPEETAKLLAEALDLERTQILSRLERASGFVFLKRKITPTESERVKALQQEGKLPGITLVPEFGRSYPEQELASHVIGYVGVDNVGLAGIEYTLNETLSPSTVGPSAEEVFGNQVFLTLDVNVQYFAEQAARKALKENRADSVFVMVVDAASGDILAYTAVPDFDPNEYNRFPTAVRQNLPLVRAYEPGSVFKVFSISSFLQLGGLRPEDRFLCDGVYEKVLPDGQRIEIRDLRAHGWVTPQLILKYSCNVGAAYASERVGADEFYKMLQAFGFGSPTELPLPGESAGILSPPSRWSARSKATIAFGQEISVSAVQMVAAATVLANRGVLLRPHILHKIVSPQGEVVRTFGREPVREVLSPEVAREVLEWMESATGEGGTARRGRIDGLRISAKTGTAQVLDPDTGRYSDTDYVSSYLGILPTDHPQFIIYVVINHPRGDLYYGSQVAAPVFREVAERLAEHTGIPTGSERVVHHPGRMVIEVPPQVVPGSTMPDLTGTPKRLLLPLLGVEDLKVRIVGDGYVVRQDPPPGATLEPGSTVTLELE